MKILTRADAARFLLEHDHFAILSHRRPDGDTVGSSAALCRGLRQLGKTAHVLVNKEVTPRFAWLHEGLTKPWVEEGDTIVSVDVASPEMLPADFRSLLGKIALRIDHHSSATSFTEQELVDRAAARSVRVHPLSQYCHAVPPIPSTLVLGYAGLTEEDLDRAAGLLRDAYVLS